MTVSLQVKNAVSSAFHYAGGFYLLSNSVKKAPILMYHRIVNPGDTSNEFLQPGMYVFRDTFRSHLTYLKRHYHILKVQELIARAQNGQDLKRYCAITFDDGWVDTFNNAYPLLMEFKIPATVFLATGFIGTDRLFWPEELSFLLQQVQLAAPPPEFPALNKLLASVQVMSRDADAFYDAAIMELKQWTPDDREDLLSQLRSLYNHRPQNRLLMNWEEAKEMQQSGLVTFGAHTLNHVLLDQVPVQEAEKEILQSKRDIVERLHVTPDFFSYPNGNYTVAIKMLLKKHCFKAAVTTKKGIFDKNSDLLEIPRVAIHQDISETLPMLLGRIWLKGF